MTIEPQKHKPRRLSSCHLHPEEPVTGFCVLCLRERLSGLDSSSANAAGPLFQKELRRCKSYAVGKFGPSSSALEPRRKSCDDKVRKNTLWHLFILDDEENCVSRGSNVESKNLGVTGVAISVIEGGDNIRVSEDALGENVNVNMPTDEDVSEEETKTMKDHIEFEWQSIKHSRKNLKDFAEGFLLAASVVRHKLGKWRLKNQFHGSSGDLAPSEKINRWKPREMQSEIGDYTYDRISLDDHQRLSFEEHRASWDGYRISRTIPRLPPTLSVIENAIINENETTSCGSAQTRDYCSDSSSSHRQNSFDCSSSGKSSSKKTVAVEVDEMNSNKFVVKGGDSRDAQHKECFDSACKTAISIAGGSDPNGFKKSGMWLKGCNILGFMHRHHGDIYEKDQEKGKGNNEKQNWEGNEVVINGDTANGSVINECASWKLVRSGSVSSRSSCKMNGSYHRSLSVAEARDCANKKSREDSAMEPNRNGMMYSPSPSNLDNGLLRFHLTPTWSHRKKSGKSRLRNSDSITRSVFRWN